MAVITKIMNISTRVERKEHITMQVIKNIIMLTKEKLRKVHTITRMKDTRRRRDMHRSTQIITNMAKMVVKNTEDHIMLNIMSQVIMMSIMLHMTFLNLLRIQSCMWFQIDLRWNMMQQQHHLWLQILNSRKLIIVVTVKVNKIRVNNFLQLLKLYRLCTKYQIWYNKSKRRKICSNDSIFFRIACANNQNLLHIRSN